MAQMVMDSGFTEQVELYKQKVRPSTATSPGRAVTESCATRCGAHVRWCLWLQLEKKGGVDMSEEEAATKIQKVLFRASLPA